ncbi:MAG TPA: CPBP family intramembrane glutamic endopeptidase [Steroidobacteraceae bacterium]|nr:CPBP family intramembrane glutamic endopeptidase [Steroidobacteraceae bacterium]
MSTLHPHSEGARLATGPPERNARAAVLELVAAVVVIAAFLWFGRQLFPGAPLIFASVLLLITASSHRRVGEQARDIGFRWDTAAAATAWLVPVVLVGAAIALAVGTYLGSLRLPTAAQAARSLVQFIASGLLQQYLLLGFFYRRCIEIVRSPAAAGIVTAIVFAALHVPNGFLIAVTLGAGLISCAVYRRAPNLYVSGLAHGVLVYVLYEALPHSITGNMRVGIEYLQHYGTR